MKKLVLLLLIVCGTTVQAQVAKQDTLRDMLKKIDEIKEFVDGFKSVQKNYEAYMKDSVKAKKQISELQQSNADLEKTNLDLEKSVKQLEKDNDSLRSVIKNAQSAEKEYLEAQITALLNEKAKLNEGLVAVMLKRAELLKAGNLNELKKVEAAYQAINQTMGLFEKQFNKDSTTKYLKLLGTLDSKLNSQPAILKIKNQVEYHLEIYCSMEASVVKLINRASKLDDEARNTMLSNASFFSTIYPYLDSLVKEAKRNPRLTLQEVTCP
jgi:septal ring factor EnvC (AmiA/AmiB activator)